MANAKLIGRVTGIDMPTQWRFGVGGTDLGIPYFNETGTAVTYLFGDTFEFGVGSQGWRSPVALWSDDDPKKGLIEFKGSLGGGYARELTSYRHDVNPKRFGAEWTRIPNDGVSFAQGELGANSPAQQYISFHSVNDWPRDRPWKSNYSALAVSKNGGASFEVIAGGRKDNAPANLDPYQMVSMVKDPDGYVYFFSVRCGRQVGPMMLRRVRWNKMWDNASYENWGFNGGEWRWGKLPCSPILWGNFGEPSVRRLPDGTYVMGGLVLGEGLPKIVTRHAPRPDAPWSNPKTQLTSLDQAFLYGGFIDPRSTKDNLNMMVSTWGDNRYDVSQWRGSI